MKKSVNKLLVSSFFLIVILFIFSTSFVSAGNGYGGKGLENRLVGYYKLDNNANDSSLYKVHGTMNNNPGVIADRFGDSNKALNLDGINDYVSISNNVPQGLTLYGFTTAGWFYIDNINGNSRLIAKEDSSSTWTFRTLMLSGNLYAQVQSSNAIVTQAQGSLTGYTGQWVFIASTYDQDRLNLYIGRYTDNSLTLLQSSSLAGGANGALMPAGSASYGIGARGSGENPFDGRIDDVRIYDRTLNKNELEALFMQGRNNAISRGLKLYTPLNDGNTNIIQDFSGENNTGTSIGPISQNGRLNQSYRFDGNNDFIIIDSSSANGDFLSENITVAAWVSLNKTDHWDHIVTKRGCDPINDTNGLPWPPTTSEYPCNDKETFQWSLQTDASPIVTTFGRYAFGVERDVGGGQVQWAYGSKIIPYQWAHVVGVYDGRNLSIYVNGILEGRTTFGSYARIKPILNVPIILGARQDNSGSSIGYAMDGALDEVKIYNRALSQSEVWELYRNTPLELKSYTSNPIPSTFDPNVGYTYGDINMFGGATQLIQGDVLVTTRDGINYRYDPTLKISSTTTPGIPASFNLSYGVYFSWNNGTTVPIRDGLKWFGREGTQAKMYGFSSSGGFFSQQPGCPQAFPNCPFNTTSNDFVSTAWYHGISNLDGGRFAFYSNTSKQKTYIPNQGTFTTERAISELTNGLPTDKFPKISYWYRFSNCRFISSISDVDKNSRINSTDRLAISSIIGTTSAYGGCEDLNGDEIVNNTDLVVIDEVLGELSNGFRPLLPKNTELHVWYNNSANGYGQVFSWDGNSTSSQYEDLSGIIVGLPLSKGAPRLAYYDDLTERIIVWYKNSGYESADGRNFRLFIGPGADLCTSDNECNNGVGQYCSLAGVCTPTCTAGTSTGCAPATTTSQCVNGNTDIQTTINGQICSDPGERVANICSPNSISSLPVPCGDGIGGCIVNASAPGVNDYCADCGDLNVEGLEQCDDGNLNTTDTCTNSCAKTFCGDGIRNTPNGDGLNEFCDSGANNGQPTFCNALCTGITASNCGNMVVELGETCDDGNLNNNDACTNSCLTAVCGDGIIRTSLPTPETCDDGNTNNNDGCSSLCVLEPGYTCTGEPTICEPIKLGLCSNLPQTNCENSVFWEYELLSAIEIVHESFADANGLDRDFCTNNQSDDAECGCKWAPGSPGSCIEFVWYDSDKDKIQDIGEQCFAKFNTAQLQGGVCDGTNTEYTIGWNAYDDVGTTIPGNSAIGCVPGSKTFQCPVNVSLPFFTLGNLIISILAIFAIYAVIYYGKKRNSKKK